jgi:hypothetical protein
MLGLRHDAASAGDEPGGTESPPHSHTSEGGSSGFTVWMSWKVCFDTL